MSTHLFYPSCCRAHSFEREADFYYPYPKPKNMKIPEEDKEIMMSSMSSGYLYADEYANLKRARVLSVFDKFLSEYKLFRETFVRTDENLHFRYKFDEFSRRQYVAAHVVMGYAKFYKEWTDTEEWNKQYFYESINALNKGYNNNFNIIKFFLAVSGELSNKGKNWYGDYPHSFTPAQAIPAEDRKTIMIPADYALSSEEKTHISLMGLEIVPFVGSI